LTQERSSALEGRLAIIKIIILKLTQKDIKFYELEINII